MTVLSRGRLHIAALCVGLAQRITDPGALLEVITRQYYEIRTLEDVKAFDRDGKHFVTGNFELSGERLHLVSTATDFDSLAATLDSVDDIAGPAPENLAVDLYVSWPDAPTDGDALSAQLQAVLAAHPSTGRWRRVTVTAFGSATRKMTYRRTTVEGSEPLAEDTIIRDMHPLTGQRLDLWRLKNFDGIRLPASAGTYLFHLTSKDNPSDERLVALAEIRGITTQLDDAGNIVAVPEIERTVAACLDGIRRAQAGRGKKRLEGGASSTTEIPGTVQHSGAMRLQTLCAVDGCVQCVCFGFQRNASESASSGSSSGSARRACEGR